MFHNLIDKVLEAHKQPKILPGSAEVESFTRNLLEFLFPVLNDERLSTRFEVETRLSQLRIQFKSLIIKTEACENAEAMSVCVQFFKQLNDVFDLCQLDADAIVAGDPAANDRKEVVRAYPGFYAIAVYRMAHLMYQLDIPYLPRIMSEYAHSKTGIDIHPAAQIGHHFCIDHGTGVVIGETTVIGNHVKVYQGVTLGALSVEKKMAKKKRHPTIGDDVILYSGATILGGETNIGARSIIGGNTWITESVPQDSVVYYTNDGQQKIADL